MFKLEKPTLALNRLTYLNREQRSTVLRRSEWVNPLKLYIRISDCGVCSFAKTDLPAASIHLARRASFISFLNGEEREKEGVFVPFFAWSSFSIQNICTVRKDSACRVPSM